MAVAVGIKIFHPVFPESRLSITLGIEFNKVDLAVGYGGDERNIMRFLHRVFNAYEIFVLNRFNFNDVLAVCVLKRKWRKSNSAAADYRFARGLNNVTSHGADVELAFCHI